MSTHPSVTLYVYCLSPPFNFYGNGMKTCTVGSCFAMVILWRFAFTTLVESGRALLTYGASLVNSSILSLLSALLALSAVHVFLLYLFSAVLWSWLWFFHQWRPSKRQERRKNQNSWRYILSWCLLNHGLGLLQQNKKWFDWYFSQLSV